MPETGEVILAMPSPVLPLRHARSTVLLASITSIRDLGRMADYEARLSTAQRDVLLHLVAGTWVPVDVALAHYDACDQLGLALDQQVANGRATFDRTSGTLLGTVIRMARETGVTPWSILPQVQRFWARGYDGNGIAVTALGPKEARMELVQHRLCESRYYRNALRGLLIGVVEMFCKKAYVTEKPGPRPHGSQTVRVQWA